MGPEDSILKNLGNQVVETNPFEPADTLVLTRAEHPCALRVREMWRRYKPVVEQIMPSCTSAPVDLDLYLKDVDERHIEDAYHSLSIEGYKVSNELIERIANGNWGAESHATRNDRNAMHVPPPHDGVREAMPAFSNS